MLHYFQREAGRVMLESIFKGGPGLIKTGKVCNERCYVIMIVALPGGISCSTLFCNVQLPLFRGPGPLVDHVGRFVNLCHR